MAGSVAPAVCSAGSFSDQANATACTTCDAGTYQSSSGQTSCKPCSAGSYCIRGSSAPSPCREGTYGNVTGLTNQRGCLQCPAGSACPTGSEQPSVCTPGSYANETNLPSCLRCAAGTYQSGEGNTTCDLCPESYWCAAGSSAPTPCAAGTYGGSKGLQRAEQCTECPAGSWCSAGVLIPCGTATYNDQPGASNQGACTQCPDNAVSVQGASRVAECECNARYYNERSASETPKCMLCGAGAACKVRGVTVATLPLDAGYWRLSPESTEIKRCPDAAHGNDSACVGGDGTSTPAKTRRQLGSSNACRESTTGPYCQLCDDGSGSRLYYSRSTRTCKECTGDLVAPIGTAVGIAVVLAGLGALYYVYMPHRRVPWLRMLLLRGTTMVAAFSLRAKAKQCVGFYQV